MCLKRSGSIAHDRGWLRRLREAVATGLTAEAAVERVQNVTRAKLQRQTEPYMRERLHDLDDLANRLLHQLTGQGFVGAHKELPYNSVIVARAMGPAALLEYDRAKLRGLVLEESGALSHVAIVARALGIAAVGDVANIVDLVEPGDALIVDGISGDVHLRPPPDVEHSYAEKARLRARKQAQYHKLRDVPAVTKDGVAIDLHMNAGMVVDLQHVAETGAVSVGLFRTEIQFMLASRLPKMSEQEAFYRTALDFVEGKQITFRTLDIGSDKILPYMAKVEEENPALGWRAIRIGLDRPGLLRSQLRGLLRAGSGREMRIMFPMIATLEEFETAKSFVENELAHLRLHDRAPPPSLKLGIMVEVPSMLWQLDEACKRVDFLSVGSNDLIQYLYAADRDNKRVATRFDPLSAPVLHALKLIADKARAAATPLTLCGEMGGKPLEAMVLLALGYRGLSMSAASIGPVKAMVLATNLGEAEDFVATLMDEAKGGNPCATNCASSRKPKASRFEGRWRSLEALGRQIRANAYSKCGISAQINESLTRIGQTCGMVIYRRVRATFYPLVLYCVSGAIGGYFVWHAVNGERGLKTKDEYEHKIATLRGELEGLKLEHASWNHRIALLSGRAIDRDLLDEEARALLGRVNRNDLVVFLPRTQK